jgi:hypothetical protein
MKWAEMFLVTLIISGVWLIGGLVFVGEGAKGARQDARDSANFTDRALMKRSGAANRVEGNTINTWDAAVQVEGFTINSAAIPACGLTIREKDRVTTFQSNTWYRLTENGWTCVVEGAEIKPEVKWPSLDK